MSLFAGLLSLVAYAFFAFRRSLRYLHIFHQEEYKPTRFLVWVAKTRSFDKRLSLALLALFLVLSGAFPFIPAQATALLVSVVFVFFGSFEKDPRKTAKKKLVITNRAKRVLGVALGLCLIAGAGIAGTNNFVFWILAVQMIPLSLALANVFLMPIENAIQKRIMNEASSILARLNPMVIGITGSFGKTSVKHILGHILELNAPTLFTPGSVNTLMGISRVIREDLKPDIRYFLVEMGAYGQGSIKKLCRLTPPRIGIVTALGEAHYERFKTLDSVARAKFELAEAVVSQNGGRMIVHEDVLEQEYARDFVAKNRKAFLVCGRGFAADLIIGNVEQAAEGLTVSVKWQNQDHVLFAPLHGMAHANNMAVAFAAAVVCGIAPDRVVAAMRTVSQIPHRLEVKTDPSGAVIIDDAYNSNPRGFDAALNLLTLLAAKKKFRRILVTPGIVELGEKNDEIHQMLGIRAAQNADVVIVVRSDKIPAFAEGFRSCATGKEILFVPSFAEARAWLNEKMTSSDVVLFENDLPDVDEARLVL